MSNPFQIWIDRLKNGQKQLIKESITPGFLDINEEELVFDCPVKVNGQAYLTESELILQLSASTIAKMPCAICNQMMEFHLSITNFYHAEPISDIPSGIYSFEEPLREALLIELPKYVECSNGKCPGRDKLTPFLRSETKKQENTHFPFSNLDS